MTENEAIKYLKKRNRDLRLMEYDSKGIECNDTAIKALEEIQQYRGLGTVDELREAMEKQRAKKPANVEEDYFVCPRCGTFITALDDFSTHKYCLNCGQCIGWPEVKD